VMGGILDVAGIHGFLTNLDEFYDESDAEGAQWRSFVAAWWNEHQTRPARVADLFGLIGDDVTLPLGEGSDQSRKVRLGQMLTQARDRMFDLEVAEGESLRTICVCLRRGDMKKRAYEWRLEQIGNSAKEKPVSLLKDSPKTHQETHPLSNVSEFHDLGTTVCSNGESGESECIPTHMRAHTRTRTEDEDTHQTHHTHPPDDEWWTIGSST